MQTQAQQGLDLNEALYQPVAPAFAGWAAQPAEWHRTLTQWYPVFERAVLQSAPQR
jgi:hypothetical protein